METSFREDERDQARLTAKDAFDIHRQMVVSLFLATFVLAVVLATTLWRSQITALMAVAAAGALGGFVSALRRLYAFHRIFPSDVLANWQRRANIYILVYSLIPPLVGAIAAATIYVVFAAHLVQGDLFPEFVLSKLDPKRNEFHDFVYNWQPNSPTSYAKAIVWGFIAGFSERFVPDILERLGTSEDNRKKG